MRIEPDIKLDFKDVLIRPKRSKLVSRSVVDLNRTFNFKHSGNQWTGIPIIAANMDTIGTFEMAESLLKYKMMTALHKHYPADKLIQFFTNHSREELSFIFYSLGMTDNDYSKFKTVYNAVGDKIQNICIDVANGYSETFSDFVKKVRKEYPNLTIMAGNVVTGEMVEALILSGADIVKVGIGPGSVCTTRKITGVGYPQLSAIIECADAAHGMNAQICADGGLTVPGDFSKAFGAGADFVMSGAMFAGHEETGGQVIELNGKKFKEYYGMSSATAMKKYNGGIHNYRASEGKHVLIPYKGPVDTTVQQILGGLRSACTYVGASRLKDLTKCTTFIRVTRTHNTLYGDSDYDYVQPN